MNLTNRHSKRSSSLQRLLLLLLCLFPTLAQSQYIPTEENLKARRAFEGFRFGIFIHWGIYSEFAQGEWYLNNGILADEYAKAASCFYPVRFDADAWVRAIKDAGARYITFTSRHHDGFSMYHTRTSEYNIVDATPFGRDIVAELARACADEGLRFQAYYSLLDWHHPDYPHAGDPNHPDREVPGITNEGRDIADEIYRRMGRTVTILEGEGLISGRKVGLYCVLNRFEIYELKSIIQEVDGSAFIAVSDVSEIIGNHIKKKSTEETGQDSQ